MMPDDRPPVSTYAQALGWLWRHSPVEEWLFDPEAALPREALLVCDMFWTRRECLIRDLRRMWNDITGDRRASRRRASVFQIRRGR